MAETSREEVLLFSLGLIWVDRASRAARGLLICQSTMTSPATTSGAAAEAHGKVADGPREVRASASAFFGRKCLTRETREGKGLTVQ